MRDQILDFLVYGLDGLVPVIVFFIIGFANLVLSLARFYRFFFIQQEKSIISFAIKNLLQGASFIIGALVVAPNPLIDFSIYCRGAAWDGLSLSRFSW